MIYVCYYDENTVDLIFSQGYCGNCCGESWSKELYCGGSCCEEHVLQYRKLLLRVETVAVEYKLLLRMILFTYMWLRNLLWEIVLLCKQLGKNNVVDRLLL